MTLPFDLVTPELDRFMSLPCGLDRTWIGLALLPMKNMGGNRGLRAIASAVIGVWGLCPNYWGLWLSLLTLWHLNVIVSYPCPVDHWCQFTSKLVHSLHRGCHEKYGGKSWFVGYSECGNGSLRAMPKLLGSMALPISPPSVVRLQNITFTRLTDERTDR